MYQSLTITADKVLQPIQGQVTLPILTTKHQLIPALQAEARNIRDHPADLVPVQIIRGQAQGAALPTRGHLQALAAAPAIQAQVQGQAVIQITPGQVLLRAAVQATRGQAAAQAAIPGPAAHHQAILAVQATRGRVAAQAAIPGPAAHHQADQAVQADHQVAAQEAAAPTEDKPQFVNNYLSKHLSNFL